MASPLKSNLLTRNSFSGEHNQASSVQRSFLAEAVLLMYALFTLGVLRPQLEIGQLSAKQAISDFATSHLANYVSWVPLAVVASLLVPYQWARLRNVASACWPIALLIGFCMVSSLWSDHPLISLRRAFALILPGYILLISMTYMESPRRATLIVYFGFWAALALNLAVLPLPVAFDEFSNFRGAAGDKNVLGSTAALALIVGGVVWSWSKTIFQRLLWIPYMVMWAAVLIFTHSKTCIGLIVIVAPLFFVLNTCSQLLRLNISSVLLSLVLLTFVALALSMVALGDPLGIEQLWNSDQSFTGRVPIWKLVLHQANGRWLFGHGFGSLWGVGYDAPNLRSPYEYIAVLNEGHNGYFDILATLGVLGLAIWIIVLLRFGATSECLRVKAPEAFLLAWLVMLFCLLQNGTESTILVPFNPVWHLTLFSILLVSWSAAESN